MNWEKLIQLHHKKESQGKIILKTEKDQEEAEKAGAKHLDESELDEPTQGELEETEIEELAENDPGEPEEGVPM